MTTFKTSLRQILLIAWFGVFKAIRSKIIFALLLICLPVLFGAHLFDSLNVGMQVKFIKDVGVSFLSVFSAVLLLFLAFDQIFWFDDSKPSYFIFSRVKNRANFIVGNFLGIAITIFISLFAASILFLLFLLYTKGIWFWEIFYGALLVFWKFSIIAAVLIFFATLCSRLMAISLTLLVVILAASQEFLRAIFTQSFLLDFCTFLLPDFHIFASRAVTVHDLNFSFGALAMLFVHALSISAFYLILASFALENRDL